MSFEEIFVNYASPALCGIKTANLFSINEKTFTSNRKKICSWNSELNKNGKRIIVLKRDYNFFLIFIYDEKALKNRLFGKNEILYLEQKGYPTDRGLSEILIELYKRLSKKSQDFPHEVGLFLGYPLSDVIDFEQKGGSKSLYTGFWQVYSNVNEACKTMDIYKECRNRCCRLLEKGISIPIISKSYNKDIYMEA